MMLLVHCEFEDEDVMVVKKSVNLSIIVSRRGVIMLSIGECSVMSKRMRKVLRIMFLRLSPWSN